MARISPNTLYGEITLALLNPATRSLGLLFADQMSGALMGSPLPFSLSVPLIWPQFAGMVAAMLMVFTIAYIAFQRQEIRA